MMKITYESATPEYFLVDVGAANASIPERWDVIGSKLNQIMFEPDERSYQELVKTLPSRSIVLQSALSSKQESRELHLTRKPEVSSFFKPNRRLLDLYPNPSRWDIVKTVRVEAIPLDRFLYDPILDVDFIKLDTQGSELEILMGAQSSLELALGIEVEVEFISLYENQPLFGDVCTYLQGQKIDFFDFVTEYRYGRKEL